MINAFSDIHMRCAFQFDQILVHPDITRGASNSSPVIRPQLTAPRWAKPCPTRSDGSPGRGVQKPPGPLKWNITID